LSGSFDTLVLPPNLEWNVAYGPNDLVLSVVGPGLAGDFNRDGAIDAADYVVWRKNIGAPPTYQTWRSNFGRTASGAVSAAISSGAVPEPASWIICLAAACACLATRPRLV
jgi:hypothetical protein